MKHRYSLAFIALMLLGCISAKAQQDLPIRFKNGNFVTGNNISRSTFNKDDLQPALSGGKYFVLIQFATLPSKSTKQSLQNNGVELGTYLPGNAYLASIKNNFDFSS